MMDGRRRQGITQVERILLSLLLRVSTKQRSKEELRCLGVYQEPIHASLEATDAVLLRKDRLWQPIPHEMCGQRSS